MNGDGVAMEVESPMLTGNLSPSPHHHPLAHQTPPENFELNTEQIKKILAFGKDLQALYNSLTAEMPNEKFKVLLQVCITTMY